MTAASHQDYVDRWRERARARKVHDWRLTLLPAAIDYPITRARALQLCKALCDRQKGYHPEVIASTYDLADELGMDRRHLYRETQVLVKAGLLRVVIGGGRLPAPRGTTGRADIYQLGPRVAARIDDVFNSAPEGAVSAAQTAPQKAPYRVVARSSNSAPGGAPTPFGVLRTPPGDTGERAAALTGGSSPIQPSSPTIAPHRLRDLFRSLSLGKGGSPNAL